MVGVVAIALVSAALVSSVSGATSAVSPTREDIVFVSDWAENLGAYHLYSVDAASGRRVRLSRTRFSPAVGTVIAPDAKHVAFIDVEDAVVADIHLRRRKVLGHMDYHSPFVWSRDGRQLAFVTSDPNPGLYVARADGSGAKRLADAPCSMDVGWSPDGDHLVLGTCDGLTVISRDGIVERSLAPAGFSPAWSPDGSTVAFLRSESEESNALVLLLVAADGSTPAREVLSGDLGLDAPLWSPTSDALALVRDDRVVTVTRSGSVRVVGERETAQPAWSPDGRSLAFVRKGATVRILNVPRGTKRTLRGVPNEKIDQPVWTPGGGRLIYAATLPANDTELFVMSSRGRHMRQLTHNVAAEREPAWSPDHTQIAFVRDAWRDDTDDPYTGICRFCRPPWIYVMTSSGTNVRRLVRGSHPAWSPDGMQIAFDDGYDIFTIPAAGGRRRHVSGIGEWRSEEPTWSPDGRQIAFDRAGRITLVSAAGGRGRYVTPPDRGDVLGSDWVPSWSPDGTKIAFGRGYSVCVLTLKKRHTHCLRRRNAQSPDWSPDGSRLIFDWWSGERSVIAVSTLGGRITRVLPRTRVGKAYQPDW